MKSAELDARREFFNRLIREWADVREGVAVCDLWASVKYHSMSKEEREEVWDDGLHFTEKGYRRIGVLVGACLVGMIEAEREIEPDVAKEVVKNML